MDRRTLLCGAAALAALWLQALPARAHTPYRQWDIFRRRYLQILTAESDPAGDAVGDLWVAQLRQRLPESRAMVSRARDLRRIASLLKTNQAKLAVLSHADARAITQGQPPFEEFAPLPLQILVDDGTFLLATREDLPLYHGYAITAALMEEKPARLSVPLDGRFGMPAHPGARAVALGETIPAPPPADGA